MQVTDSKNVTFDGLTMDATSTSKNPAKNTDGWDIYRSDTVNIVNTNVNNGDDCVAFKPSEWYR
jgi:galacturan 1,4-alpha-galacturonidase